MKKLLLFLMVLATALTAHAQTGNLWVGASGTCTRSGTLIAYNATTSCSSMQAAQTAASGGDTVMMLNGTYGAQTLSTGTKSSTINYIAQTTGSVIIGGGGMTINIDKVHLFGIVGGAASLGTNRPGLDIEDLTNTAFTDVVVDCGNNMASWSGLGWKNQFAAGTHITIQHCDFGNWDACDGYSSAGSGSCTGNCAIEDATRLWSWGIGSTQQPANDSMIGNVIHDVTAPPDGACGGGAGVPHVDALQVFSGGSNMVISGNKFYGNASSALQSGGGTLSNWTLENNYFGATTCCNNLVWGQATVSGSFIVRNNTNANPNGYMVVNNASASGTATYDFSSNLNIAGATVCQATGSTSGGFNVFPASGGTTCGSNAKRCNPVFLHGTPASGNGYDVTLSPSDTCAIGAGNASDFATVDIFGTTRPQGTGVEAGAYELPSGSPTVVSIAISPTSGTLNIPGTTPLTCTATLSNATTAACISPVWTSATPATATVNSSTGVVTAVAVGTSLISATASGFTSNNSTITVAPTTWYIRADGGGRSDAGRLTGSPQATSMGHYTVGCAVNSTTCLSASEVGCDGKADVSYAAAVAAAGGAIITLHCAFNDPRFLWDDQTFDDLPGMIVQSGDQVVIRGGPWRIGLDAMPGSCSGARCGAGYTWNYGNPTPNSLVIAWPSGTSTAHTHIYGENFASCNTGPNWTNTTKASLTQLYGGWGLVNPIELSGSQYVDMKCLEVTRHSNCVSFGSPALPSGCTSSSDYDSDGIHMSSTTSNITLTDMWIHGHTGRGIKGGIGGPVTATRVNIDTNGAAGWDFDDGTTHLIGTGAVWSFLYSIIQWSGCNQEYPATDPIPVATCYSVSTGGYGDGVGTPAGTGLSAIIDHSGFIYNTQDALDLGHVDTGGPYPLSITNSYAYSNNGGTFKWDGNASPAVVTNNYVVGDCLRMQYAITGVPSGYNTNLADFCRSGDTMPFQTQPFSNFLIANNTIVTYFPTIFDYDCVVADCTAAVVNIKDNNIFGLDNPATYSLGGQAGGPNLLCGGSCNTHGNIDPPLTISHNNYYQLRNTPCAAGNPGDTCLSPLMVSQPTGNGGSFTNTELDAFNINLTSGSPLRGSGITYTGISSLDYFGNTQTVPPVMGAAVFFGSATPVTPTHLTGGVSFSNGAKFQ